MNDHVFEVYSFHVANSPARLHAGAVGFVKGYADPAAQHQDWGASKQHNRHWECPLQKPSNASNVNPRDMHSDVVPTLPVASWRR